MTNETPPRRPRNWLDALIATALRWNDRLSRPVYPDEPAAPATPARGHRTVGISQDRSRSSDPAPRSR